MEKTAYNAEAGLYAMDALNAENVIRISRGKEYIPLDNHTNEK